MMIIQPLKPYRTSFILGVFFLFGLTLIFNMIFENFSAEGFGRWFGITMFSSFITGFQAKRSKAPWSKAKFVGVYTLVIFVVFLMTIFGDMRRS